MGKELTLETYTKNKTALNEAIDFFFYVNIFGPVVLLRLKGYTNPGQAAPKLLFKRITEAGEFKCGQLFVKMIHHWIPYQW